MGYYRIENVNGSWVTFAPDGSPVYLTGMNHAGDGRVYPFDFASKFGSHTEWVTSLRDQLSDWGFNYLGPTIAALSRSREYLPSQESRATGNLVITDEWSADEYALLDYPFTTMIDYPGIHEMKMDENVYPDVFSPQFQETLDRHCESICGAFKDNPNLVGYHITHNPPWAYIDLGIEPDFTKWIDPVVDAPYSPARKRWAYTMRRIYGTTARYQRVYYPIQDFAEIESIKNPMAGVGSFELVRRDKIAFIRDVAKEWYRSWHDAIRRHDPHHLILGDRMTIQRTMIPNYVLEIMRPYVDALSIITMETSDQMMETLRETLVYWDKPILVSDVGATKFDGRFKSGSFLASYDEVGEFYWDHLRLGLQHPQIIGLAWCGYWETTTHHSGLVDPASGRINNTVADAMREANSWVQSALATKVEASRAESEITARRR
jgi:hypothetical protein